MIENENNIQIIQELTEQFDFSELSKSQKELVLSQVSEDAYSDMREAVKNTLHYFEQEPKLIASDSLKPTVNKDNVILRIVNYKIPFYKVAAAALLLFFINSFDTNKPENEIVEKSDPIIEMQQQDKSLAFEGIEDFKKYTSNNSIKHNTGLARVY